MKNGGRSKNSETIVEESSGNVFADLGLKNPDELMAKAELVRRITELITEIGLTESKATKLLGIESMVYSSLLSGRLADFSTDQLFRFLNSLGQDVEVRIRPASSGAPSGTFTIATTGDNFSIIR